MKNNRKYCPRRDSLVPFTQRARCATHRLKRFQRNPDRPFVRGQMFFRQFRIGFEKDGWFIANMSDHSFAINKEYLEWKVGRTLQAGDCVNVSNHRGWTRKLFQLAENDVWNIGMVLYVLEDPRNLDYVALDEVGENFVWRARWR